MKPFSHLGLKLLSLAMALVLWMVVSGEETVERGLRVPLELQQVPAGLELTGDVPTTVDLRVRGPSGALGRVSPGDVVAMLDLRGAQEGRRLFPLTPEQIRVPFGVQVVQVTPSAIAMAFERSASRQVAVVPAVDGHPSPGYVVGAKSVDPARVEVVGPESVVKSVAEVLTEPVSVAGARDRVTQTVAIGVLDPSLRLKNARSATVTVQIVPAPLERTVRSRPVHLRGLASTLEAQATPAVVDVGVRASREAFGRIEPDNIVAFIDVAGLGAGIYTLTVHADSPPDVGILHIEPASVQVRIASPGRH
jgi:YbbR domain-containing protein